MRRREWVRVWPAAVSGATLLLMLSPVVVLVFSSFDGETFFRFPPQNYSLHWYVAAWHSEEYRDALGVSVAVAALATVIAVPCGALAAYALVRGRLPGRALIEAVLLAPLALPLIVWAIALLQIYARIGLSGSWTGLVLAHSVIVLPFPVRLLAAAIQRIDPVLEQAAMTLGATPIRAAWRVTLPLAASGLVTAAALAFLVSFNDVVVSSFIAGARTMTFQVRLYSQLRSQGVDPITLAIGAAIVGLIIGLAVVGEWLFRWSRHV